jgi:hypothetical protein
MIHIPHTKQIAQKKWSTERMGLQVRKIASQANLTCTRVYQSSGVAVGRHLPLVKRLVGLQHLRQSGGFVGGRTK